MNIDTYNIIRNNSSYEKFINLFIKFSQTERKFSYDIAVTEIMKDMPKVLYVTEGMWSDYYADSWNLDTNYQQFYDKIVSLHDNNGKQIYNIETTLFKSEFNLYHKIWKINCSY